MDRTTPAESRAVRSADPTLSPAANQALTDELRLVVGHDTAEVPEDRADPATAAHGRHRQLVTEIAGAPLGAVFTALTAVCVGAVVALTTGSTLVLVLALAVLGLATLLAVRAVGYLTAESEHPSPETAALLEREGVADPDRLLGQLVDEFAPADAGAPPPAARPSRWRRA